MSRKGLSKAKQRCLLAATALLGCSALTAAPASAKSASSPPTCGLLANQLLQYKDIIAATSAIQPASNGNSSYCLVHITVSDLQGPEDGYLPGQRQMINIAVGLPLSVADGGSGGVQGAWNGRNENFGGGGYVGLIGSGGFALPTATNAGYASSDTDAGNQDDGSGAFALNPNGTLNWGLIRDFSYNGIHEQNIWTKNLVQMYYGMSPEYNYFNGCSTGGRQAHMQAQRYPEDFDGILGGDPAISFDRLSSAQQWGQVAMNQLLGAPISLPKLQAVTQAAIAACDALDGITDGIIQDPRACHYNAKQFVCTGKAGDPANCLTPAEAQAVNQIWDGPPGPQEDLPLWFGLERGTPLAGFFLFSPTVDFSLDAAVPLSIPVQWLQYWVFQNPNFDWHVLTESSFDQAFRDGEIKFNQVVGTYDTDLSAFKEHGGRMIVYHGLVHRFRDSARMPAASEDSLFLHHV
jgi:Tannase and feruloyl esterase